MTITITTTVESFKGQTTTKTLRKITPSKDFIGFTKYGKPINAEILKLCKALEPTATGFYLS